MDLSPVTAWVATWASHHPFIFTFFVVPLILAAANGLIALMTSKRWEALLAKYPRPAAFLKILEAAGVSPVKVVKWTVVLLTGKPYDGPGASSGPSNPPESKQIGSDKSDPPGVSRRTPVLLFGIPLRVLLPRPARVVYGACFASVLLVGTGGAILSCSADQKHIERLILGVGEAACVVLRGENAATDEVCATAEDLRPIVAPLIEKQKAKMGASPSAAPKAIVCSVAP